MLILWLFDVDRPPFSYWYHFGLEKEPPDRFAQTTLNFHQKFRTDLVKVMSDYPYPKPPGTLGAMLPPSTVLAVYGIITEQDIGKLFIAGIIPGLLAYWMTRQGILQTLAAMCVASVLVRFQGQAWMKHFIKGMTPAIVVLMALVAWQLFRVANPRTIQWRAILLAALSFVALYVGTAPQYVLIGAGVLGVILYNPRRF